MSRRLGSLQSTTTRGLLVRFAAAALISLVAVAALTSRVIRSIGVRDAKDSAESLNEVIANGVIGPALTADVIAGDERALDHLDSLVRGGVLRGSLVRVKIWAADGRVVYSDERRIIGEVFSLGADARRVLSGAGSVSELSDLEGPEDQYERSGSQLLEVYSPLSGPNDESLLLETSFAYDTVLSEGRKAARRYAPASLGALALLQLAQIPVVVQLVRRLRAAHGQREALLHQSLHVSATERRRIASNLHDGAVQDLTGVAFNLGALSRDHTLGDEHRIAVADASTIVQASVHGLRSVLVEIAPPNLAGQGLESALSDMLARLRARGFATSLVINEGALPLPVEAGALLYRAALEATRNITMHSRAARVTLTLRNADGKATLAIEDDGRGFDPTLLTTARFDGHTGLRLLSELVSGYGGELSVDSAAGRGTRLTIEVRSA